MIKLNKRRTVKQDKKELKSYFDRSTVAKYCTLCQNVNLDPSHPLSIHIIFIMFSKYRNKEAMIDKFRAYVKEQFPEMDFPPEIDYEAFDKEESRHFICSMSDWIVLIQYLECIPLLQNATEESEDAIIMKERVFNLCSVVDYVNSVNYSQLNLHYPCDVTTCMRALLYISVQGISAVQMIERFYLNMETESTRGCNDLEVKCLRLISQFNDYNTGEDEHMTSMAQILALFQPMPSFVTDVNFILAKERNSAQEQASGNQSKRFQLRKFIKTTQVSTEQEQSVSFESWVAQQHFPSTMSKQLQQLLYFIHVQQQTIPEEYYMKFFTTSMTERMQDVKIQEIDINVIKTVITSLRVYHYNVSDLIDFRTQCLQGLSLTTKNKLSLPQILQLYVSIYQHPSIREECWKHILPKTLNHTILSACDAFRQTHEFQIGPVIESIVKCQLGTK